MIDVATGGFIYRGLKPGVGREAFVAALREGRVEELLNRILVRKGDCFYLPSGTIHALGAGVMVAEVQTPSDVTYRVYDFNRIDPTTGRPRELHVEEALESMDFSGRPIVGEERSHLASIWTTVTRLVTCESFIIERVRMVEGVAMPITYGGMVVWIVVEGAGRITSPRFGETSYPFKPGDVVLLPAALKDAVVQTQSPCVWLEVTVPEKSDLAAYPHPERAAFESPADDLVQINLPTDRPGQRDRNPLPDA